jgi:predicted dehydrogenase
VSEGNPVRLGLVGIGRAGWGMHCRELEGRESLFRIVAACDLLKERRDRMAARYGCRTYRTVEDLAADPEVELVDIATRSDFHFPQATAALRAGKHVLVEKPMTLTHAEAVRLQRQALRSRGRLFVRHNRRFETAFQHIRGIVESGLLGRVHSIRLRRGGFQRRDDWQAVMRFGGGQLLNWGPHIVDHALQFAGPGPVEQWSDLQRVAAVGDAEDHVRILLRNRAGLVVDLEISGGRILAEPEYLVSGTRGALSCRGDKIHLRRLDPNHRLPRRPLRPGTPPEGAGFGGPDDVRWIEEEIEAKPADGLAPDDFWPRLHETLRGGRPFPVTLDESVAVMKVLDAARRGTPFAAGEAGAGRARKAGRGR